MSETTLAELRGKQAEAVMPLIGGLLDAWDGMPNDLKGEVMAVSPAFFSYVELIRGGMEPML